MCIPVQGHKGSDVGEGGKIPVLIGLQDGDHAASLRMQAGKGFGDHTLAVHDHSRDLFVPRVLFIPLQKCGEAHSKMLVAAIINASYHEVPGKEKFALNMRNTGRTVQLA